MKIGVIGMGYVGTSVAISTLHQGIARDLLINDIRSDLAEGEAMDLAHGGPFYPTAAVRSAEVEEMNDCDAVVIAAGKGGGPEDSRLDLLRVNANIVRGIGERLAKCKGVIVVVTNPVDVLTQVVLEASGLPPARVIGTGTMLDTARLRHRLGKDLGLNPRAIHAHVVGEHGDSEVVLWSCAAVGGRPIREWSGWSSDRESEIAEVVRRSAYEIIRRKGATNHAIGLVTAALLRWTLWGENRVLTVSRLQEGALGISGVTLSLPTMVGTDGATKVIEPALSDDEREALLKSAEVLKKAYASI